MTPNLHAPSYALLFSQISCYRCHALTPTVAIWVPSFDEVDEVDGDMSTFNDPALLRNLEFVDAATLECLRANSPWMQVAYTQTSGTTYLAHHCTTCNALQGDHYLFEVGGPYGPQSEDNLRALRRIEGAGPLSAVAIAVW